MNFKVGDKVKLKIDVSYLGKYSGTFATIDDISVYQYTLVGFDNNKFTCPFSYIELFYHKCSCGVDTTFGIGAPAEFHSDYCKKHIPHKY